ncbi:hypothetical protein LJR225_002989 [Phenylobacterium sp. LjRoot225]|uniref:hypothetical protein n=1 Tax=Phenylobacterium sp. LjRoot225 TaxID=3342285 RepID=UPI003ECCFBD9
MGIHLRLPLFVSGVMNLFLLQQLGVIQPALATSCAFGLMGALVWDELRQRERDGEK